jgi:RyR domain-containing protein
MPPLYHPPVTVPHRKVYEPAPLATNSVDLPPELAPLLERLAEHAHDTWAERRLADGWTWGPARDDTAKRHPCLVPYEDLAEGDKEYDRVLVVGTLKAILSLDYAIVPPGR